MKYLLMIFSAMFMFAVVGCDGNNTDNNIIADQTEEPDLDSISPDECEDGETMSSTCGYNKNGIGTYVCINSLWIMEKCSDSDKCKNNSIDTIVCGYNNNGTQKTICIKGEWFIDGECKDYDECANGTTKTEECGYNKNGYIKSYCENAKWIAEECVDPDECTNGEEKTGSTPCGYNGNGGEGYICSEGTWTLTGKCNDSDECVEATTKTDLCGYNNKVVGEYLCTDGKWITTLCENDPDECKNGTYKGEEGIGYECIDGIWQQTHETYLFGEIGGDTIYDIAEDTQENIYLSGETGQISNTNCYTDSHILIKMDKSGNKIWERKWDKKDCDDMGFVIFTVKEKVLTDSSDNIYVLWTGHQDIDSDLQYSRRYIFVTKFNSNGDKIWENKYDSDYYEEIKHNNFILSAAIDSNANIFISVLFYNTKKCMFASSIFKIANNGNKIQEKVNDRTWDMAIDANDNIYYMYENGIAKLDNDLKGIWYKYITEEDTYISTIAVSQSGNLYIAGGIEKSMLNYKSYLTKLDSDGDEVWTKKHDSEIFSQYTQDIAIDNNENIYMLNNLTYFTEEYNRMYYISAIKFNKDGEILWTEPWYSDNLKQNEGTVGTSILANDEYVYVAGESPANLDGSTLSENNGIFLSIIPSE